MFDLEREVEAWTERTLGPSCLDASRRAELVDHLQCEIERGRAQGLSDELAFRAATERLGDPRALRAENGKNRSLLARLCEFESRALGGRPDAGGRRLLIANGAIWGTLVVATAIVTVGKRQGGSDVSLLLFTSIFPSLWLASDLLLRRALVRRSGGGGR